MPDIDLELQMKFLADLDSALNDAVGRYSDQDPEKLEELHYMQQEVIRAYQVVRRRLDESDTPAASSKDDEYYIPVAAQ